MFYKATEAQWLEGSLSADSTLKEALALSLPCSSPRSLLFYESSAKPGGKERDKLGRTKPMEQARIETATWATNPRT